MVGHYKKLALTGEVKINLSDCPDLLPPLAVKPFSAGDQRTWTPHRASTPMVMEV